MANNQAHGAEGTAASVLSITPPALELVLEARAGEDAGQDLALFVEVSGVAQGAYTYDIWFEAARDAAPGDDVEHHGELTVVFPKGSADKLAGATLDVGDDGLVIVNPNTPPPEPGSLEPGSFGTLDGPLAAAALAVLEEEVNPQIAAHGGRADLVGVDEEGVAYLRLSGGCQGCGLAQVTLSQGIAVAIQEAVPGIVRIVDVTAHAQGSNPYYQASKK
jgi:Fe/S biogenesis protein NfuA